VQEARGWSLDLAWVTFNYGLILMAGGALVLLYNNLKDEHPHQVFALVWSIVMFFSTWQHIRYEYYLAVNIALLSAVCVSFSFERGFAGIYSLTASVAPGSDTSDTTLDENTAARKTKRQKKGQKKPSKSLGPDYLSMGLVVIAAGMSVLFIFTSASYSYENASSNAIRMNGDWKESLEWMANNTPDTGVNYFTIYDRKTFTYPNQSYGVMSWWDYGHMITYIAKRIPNANPFQQGVSGSTGAAAYFMTESEETADAIADSIGTRYVITDIEMDTGKFWAMATWFNSSAGTGPYQTQFVVTDPAQPDRYQDVVLNNASYYLTMVSRLHNFDGSMTDPQKVYYVEYVDPSVSRVSVPVITNAIMMNSSESLIRALQYNLKAPAGYHAATYSSAIYLPVEPMPALRHYRLVHESSTNVFAAKIPDIKYVKVFEYVKGAHIKGEGVIEIPLVSNTGRQFTYRQQSTNGEFIVPYSTTGNPYGVKSLGKYRIVNSKKEFDVPENAVMRGLNIN
jgi:dolichyl-diphosphooligosaccharide--protein glycosyltransferase